VTTFVHIADERHSSRIRSSGLKLPRPKRDPGRPWGVFAMPVVPNFVVSHQWVRELKKRGFRVAVGVYFSLPDSESVWAGRYNRDKVMITAAEASARLLREEELGFEVVIPRSIAAREISSIRSLPQTVGWRHFPEAHERGIFCACKFCQKGEIKSQRLRARNPDDAF
jgi:hypothetical protein